MVRNVQQLDRRLSRRHLGPQLARHHVLAEVQREVGGHALQRVVVERGQGRGQEAALFDGQQVEGEGLGAVAVGGAAQLDLDADWLLGGEVAVLGRSKRNGEVLVDVARGRILDTSSVTLSHLDLKSAKASHTTWSLCSSKNRI